MESKSSSSKWRRRTRWSPKPRIILHPGEVKSENDQQRHWIDAPTLARLYGVKLEDCLVQDYRRAETYRGFYARKNDIHLYPRSDGSYRILAPHRERAR